MTHPVLAPGIGKVLMSDEGARVHAPRRFDPLEDEDLKLLDGGAPGPARTFAGEEMGAQLSGKKKTAHEVALFDLLATVDLLGRKPERRALIESWAS